MATNVSTLSAYSQSIVNRVKYNAKQDKSQQAQMDAMLAIDLESIKPADGVTITSGAIVLRINEICEVFSGDDDKEAKNTALTIMRNQAKRALDQMLGEDHGLKIGLKAATSTKSTRVEFGAKDSKPKTDDDLLAEQIAKLLKKHGAAKVAAEVTKQIDAMAKAAKKAA